MTGQCSAGTPTANAVPTTTASKPASAGKTQAGLAMAIFAGVAALLL